MAKVKPTTPTTKKAKFLQYFRETGNVTKSVLAAGFDRSMAYDYRKTDPEFAQAWDDAEQQAADVLEAEAWRRAVKGVKRPIYQQRGLVGYEQVYSDTLLIFLMKGIRPEKYRERISQEVSGPKGGPIQHQALDLSKLTLAQKRDLLSLIDQATPNQS